MDPLKTNIKQQSSCTNLIFQHRLYLQEITYYSEDITSQLHPSMFSFTTPLSAIFVQKEKAPSEVSPSFYNMALPNQGYAASRIKKEVLEETSKWIENQFPVEETI